MKLHTPVCSTIVRRAKPGMVALAPHADARLHVELGVHDLRKYVILTSTGLKRRAGAWVAGTHVGGLLTWRGAAHRRQCARA